MIEILGKWTVQRAVVWWSVTLPLTDTLTRWTANADSTQCTVGEEPSSIYQVLDARGRVYRGTPALPTTKSVPRTESTWRWYTGVGAAVSGTR